MYQIISSSVVAGPPSGMILKMLHNNKLLYIPANGQKSTHAPSDTKEDMMEIFQADPNGAPRELQKLMGRRNYAAFIAYDPNEILGMGGGIGGSIYAGSMHSGQDGLSKLNLAVDFVVQGDGAIATPTKYGPVIIPSLEFGR
jgi:PhoD related phosphatase